MKPRRLIAFWGAALAGCVDTSTLQLPPAGEHRSMIAFALGDDGSLTAAAADLSREVDLPVRLRGVEAELYLLYFGSALDQLGFDAGALQLAGNEPCSRPLPAAAETWSARAKAGDVWRRVALPEKIAKARFSFAAGSCPELGPLDVELRCGNTGCFGTMRQEGCAMTLDLSTCARDNLSLPIDRYGALCLAPNEPFGSCAELEPASPDILHTFECGATGPGTLGSCELDIYPKATSRPPLTVETKTLFEVAPYHPPKNFPRPPYGWLGDLVHLEDRVAVTAYGSVREDATFCNEVDPGRVYFLDPESMTEIGTATAPSCLGQIARDPTGDGFVGVYGVEPPVFARFDKNGKMLGSVAFTGNGGQRIFVNSVAVDPGPPAIAAFVVGNEKPDGRRSFVVGVDLATMTIDPVMTKQYGPNTRELAFYARGTFSALEDIDNVMLFIESKTGIARKNGALALVNAGVGQLFQTADKLFVVSMNGMAGGVFTFYENGDLKGRARPHSVYAEAWSIAPWPKNPRWVLAGLTAIEGRQGYLALVDLEGPRFLPGVVPAGDGPAAVGRFRGDAQGRLWAVLPWSAQVIRVF